jgi:hypothetical protein
MENFDLRKYLKHNPLTELFDSEQDSEITTPDDGARRRLDDDKEAVFTVGGIEYHMMFEEFGRDAFFRSHSKVIWHVVDNMTAPPFNDTDFYVGYPTFNFGFSQNESGKDDITGSGNAAEVFGNVINTLKKWMASATWKYLIFVAKEPSRIKLYNALVEKFKKSTPGLSVNYNASKGVYVIENTKYNKESDKDFDPDFAYV